AIIWTADEATIGPTHEAISQPALEPPQQGPSPALGSLISSPSPNSSPSQPNVPSSSSDMPQSFSSPGSSLPPNHNSTIVAAPPPSPPRRIHT
ncbi:hypothetical protein Dimus_036351, partial [Dionaea muscipula]